MKAATSFTAVMLAFMAFRMQAEEKSPETQVALFDDAGSFGKGVPSVKEQLAKAKDISVTVLKAEGIQAGLDGYNVVIFTGGSGSKQAKAIGDNGREVVKKFVENGGGYIGICAGAYLACDGFLWGLHILDAKTPSSKWMRGKGDVKIEFTGKGREILGLPSGQLDIRYANGPILVPAKNDGIADFEPLAFFRTEFAEHESPKGVMINSAAIVSGSFGKGRLIVSSPHPEQTPGMEGLIEHAVRWVSAKR